MYLKQLKNLTSIINEYSITKPFYLYLVTLLKTFTCYTFKLVHMDKSLVNEDF